MTLTTHCCFRGLRILCRSGRALRRVALAAGLATGLVWLALSPGTAAADPPAATAAEPPSRAQIVACFLLNSMTRAAPERDRRERLLRTALATGCLTLPEASPFRGAARAAHGPAPAADNPS